MWTSGGGDNGFLVIVMAAAPYLLCAGEPFLLPKHPGTQPPHNITATQPVPNLSCQLSF
jgi:hypothetical protein